MKEGAEYIILTTDFYKIWFNKNPDVFLNQENQLRLVKMRVKNPKATINLIYSESLLSEAAKKELFGFCKKHRINPVDFDKDLPKLLITENDKELYALAKEEVEMWISGKGGNPAAASDKLRQIGAVVEKFGIYSDFDVDIDFNGLATFHGVKAPVIINGEIVNGSPSINNEFMAFAIDPVTRKMHPHALKKLEYVQEEIIRRAKDLNYSINGQVIEGYQMANPIGAEIAKLVFNKFCKETDKFTIYEFRKLCEAYDQRMLLDSLPAELLQAMGIDPRTNFQELSLDQLKQIHGNGLIKVLKSDFGDLPQNTLPAELSEKATEGNKHLLYLHTVVSSTGPVTLVALVKDLGIKKFTMVSTFFFGMQILEGDLYLKFCDAWRDMYAKSNGLDGKVKSKNTVSEAIALGTTSGNDIKKNVGKLADISWSEIGASKVAERESKMNEVTSKLQKRWKERISKRKEGVQKEKSAKEKS